MEQQYLFFAFGSYRDCLDFLLVTFGVVHDHVDTHSVEGPDEGYSVDGVAAVGDDFCEVGEGVEGDEDSVEAVEGVVVVGGNGSAVRYVLWWERPEG